MGKTLFNEGDKSQGRLGTIIDAIFLNVLNNHRHCGLDQDGDGAIDYAVDIGVANAYAISLVPSLEANIPGMPIWFKALAANTGASTLNINGLGAKGIKKYGTEDLKAEDIRTGQIVCVIFDGTNYQLLSRGLTQQADAVVNYAADTGVVNAYACALTPALAAYVVGVPVLFQAASTNTGAATLNINGLGDIAIKKRGTLALEAGDILAGQMICMVYDGTNFQILNHLLSHPGKQILTGNGYWTVPPGIKRLKVTCIGGGGGGGQWDHVSAGGGGGGGAVISYYDVAPGNIIAYYVGGGGAPGGPGGTGAATYFGAYASATGGAGGAQLLSPGAGGIGTIGDILIAGNGGTAGSSYAGVGSIGGNGGGSLYGGGGTPIINGAGAAGRNYGGGGAGGNPGGAGASGVIILEY